jgi:FixJ family two-component response regulator
MPTGLRVRYREAGKSKWKSRLIDLLRPAGFATQAFASAEEFLSLAHREDTACVILDVLLPGSGH